VHGIGIGLYPYIDFLAELNLKNNMDESDGEVGIIAIEIMSVSFRITSEALEKEEMCQEIDCILKAHSWEKFVLVSHSYVIFSMFPIPVITNTTLVLTMYQLRKRNCYASPSYTAHRAKAWANFVC
jgi:predicted ferric reductase